MKKVFKASTIELANVTKFLRGELSNEVGFKPLYQLCIAVEEVFTNIATYAYKNAENTVEIEIIKDIENKNVTIVFRDTGIQFNPLYKCDPDICIPIESRKIGGLGIFMMKKMVDSVRYEYLDGKNILTIEKKY